MNISTVFFWGGCGGGGTFILYFLTSAGQKAAHLMCKQFYLLLVHTGVVFTNENSFINLLGNRLKSQHRHFA